MVLKGSTLRWIKSRGLLRRPQDYAALIGTATKRRQWQDGLALLSDLLAQHSGLKPAGGGQVAKTGDCQAIANVLPSVGGTVLLACGRASNWRLAFSLYAELRAVRSDVCATTYSGLLNMSARFAQWEHAVDIATTMSSSFVGPVVVGHTSAISACERASQWHIGLNLFENLRGSVSASSSDEALDVVSFNATISACARGHAWAGAMGLLQELQSSGLQPNSKTYGPVIASCTWASRWELALANFANAVGSAQVDIAGCGAALGACERGRRWSHALQLLADAREAGLRLDSVCAAAAVGACAAAGRWREALSLIHFFGEIGAHIDAAVFNSAISACGKASYWTLATSLLAQAEQCGHADAITMGAALSACDTASRWEAALRIFADVRCRASRLNVEACGSVANALERSAQWVLGLELLADMRLGSLSGVHGAMHHVAVANACSSAGQFSPLVTVLWSSSSTNDAELTRVAVHEPGSIVLVQSLLRVSLLRQTPNRAQAGASLISVFWRCVYQPALRVLARGIQRGWKDDPLFLKVFDLSIGPTCCALEELLLPAQHVCSIDRETPRRAIANELLQSVGSAASVGPWPSSDAVVDDAADGSHHAEVLWVATPIQPAALFLVSLVSCDLRGSRCEPKSRQGCWCVYMPDTATSAARFEGAAS